ncbi:uncharacterized protein KD926_003283 [Aspergillus affinis]|uniref:uncharacterized protein n=1 Tax=Aspergillus affinis TaxID=1070780 RepID=UPI0022FE147C|nr:uncharacterized protein KD926_003283 [Aspergillus affinis]KAI9035543.1 hypothetical protein KD926_003283 [Aspergillus affinis]
MSVLPSCIHGIQSVIALVILGCSAAKLSEESSSGFSLALFTAIATILAAIYIITTSFIAKTLFKLWVSVASNAFTLTFWIITVGVLGAAHHSHNCGGHQHNHCYRKRYYHGTNGIWAATMALSIIDGILSAIALGISCCGRKPREKNEEVA